MQSCNKSFRFLAVVRFDESDYHIDTFAELLPRGLQHSIGLTDAGGCAEEYFQLPFAVALGLHTHLIEQ